MVQEGCWCDVSDLHIYEMMTEFSFLDELYRSWVLRMECTEQKNKIRIITEKKKSWNLYIVFNRINSLMAHAMTLLS